MNTFSQNDYVRIEEVLRYWFGKVEDTIIPTEHRAKIWFAEDPLIDYEIRQNFEGDLAKARTGLYDHWQSSARGRLALILILDQFSRHIYRNTPQAFTQDEKALTICLSGLEERSEHDLSLIERIFFYFPLLHTEKLDYQEQGVLAYQFLAEISFSETRVIYDSFVKFATHHYSIIREFGRFPQRNKILGRPSSDAEMAYLKKSGEE